MAIKKELTKAEKALANKGTREKEIYLNADFIDNIPGKKKDRNDSSTKDTNSNFQDSGTQYIG